jgi:hypothetical protein
MKNRTEIVKDLIDAVAELPTDAARVKAFETLIVLMATRTRDPARLRRALKAMCAMKVAEPAELVAFKRKLVATLDAAQDDASLAAAMTAAFPQ